MKCTGTCNAILLRNSSPNDLLSASLVIHAVLNIFISFVKKNIYTSYLLNIIHNYFDNYNFFYNNNNLRAATHLLLVTVSFQILKTEKKKEKKKEENHLN